MERLALRWAKNSTGYKFDMRSATRQTEERKKALRRERARTALWPADAEFKPVDDYRIVAKPGGKLIEYPVPFDQVPLYRRLIELNGKKPMELRQGMLAFANEFGFLRRQGGGHLNDLIGFRRLLIALDDALRHENQAWVNALFKENPAI